MSWFKRAAERPPKFKPGDVVCLKSGGPRMTVSETYRGGYCVCHWFRVGSKRDGGTFSEAVLQCAKS